MTVVAATAPVNVASAIARSARTLKLIVTPAGAEKSKTFSFSVAVNLAKYLGSAIDPAAAVVEGDSDLVTETARYAVQGATLAELGDVVLVGESLRWTPPAKPVRAVKPAAEAQAEPVVAEAERKGIVKGWKGRKDRDEIAECVESFLADGRVSHLAGLRYETEAAARSIARLAA